MKIWSIIHYIQLQQNLYLHLITITYNHYPKPVLPKFVNQSKFYTSKITYIGIILFARCPVEIFILSVYPQTDN